MIRLGFHHVGEVVVYIYPFGDRELYVYTIVWCLLGIAIAAADWLAMRYGVLLRQPLQTILHRGSLVVLSLAGINLAFNNLILANPMLSGNTIVHGGAVLNSLLTAFLVPGLLLGAAAATCGTKEHPWMEIARKLLGGAALLSVVAYCTAVVRFIYRGPDQMSIFNYSIAHSEQYVYSIVWLLFAILLLVAGLVFKRNEFRLGSAAVMVLAVAKVFLIDMSALEGILRALSFVGLGVVLIAVGFVYQRLLSRPEEPEETLA